MTRAARCVGAALLVCTPIRPAAAPDVTTIVERWAAANQRDFDASPHYSYFERYRDQDGTKLYEVTPLLGSPYKRVLEKDGRSLTSEQQKQQDGDFEQARREREAESPDQRRERIAEFEKSRNRARQILKELPRAFEYTLRSTHTVNGRTVYVLSAQPRRDYDPPSVEGRVLAGMRGEFWIDAETYQLVRGRARVVDPVAVAGFFAKVQPGTEFEVEQKPVDDGVWLPSRVAVRTRSSIIFLFHHQMSEERIYFNYRKVPPPQSPERLRPEHERSR
jgi:hypothetical protein